MGVFTRFIMRHVFIVIALKSFTISSQMQKKTESKKEYGS
jgi:hypothetical protein